MTMDSLEDKLRQVSASFSQYESLLKRSNSSALAEAAQFDSIVTEMDGVKNQAPFFKVGLLKTSPRKKVLKFCNMMKLSPNYFVVMCMQAVI